MPDTSALEARYLPPGVEASLIGLSGFIVMNEQRELSAVFLAVGNIFLLLSPLVARAVLRMNRRAGRKSENLRRAANAYVICGLLATLVGAIGLLRY
jgi:hypothetical protein